MQWKITTAALLMLGITFTRASEKQLASELSPNLGSNNSFELFVDMPHELQEVVVKQFVRDSLVEAKKLIDYLRLYNSLWTSKVIKKYVMNALKDISQLSEIAYPELRYNFEILRLYAFYAIEQTKLSHYPTALKKDLAFSLHLLPENFSIADERMRERKKLYYQALVKKKTQEIALGVRGFTSMWSADPLHADTFPAIGKILMNYIKGEDILDDEKAPSFLDLAERHGHYRMVAQLIHKRAPFCTKNTVHLNGGYKLDMLFRACKYGCDSALAKLLTIDAININRKTDGYYVTPLMMACQSACVGQSENPLGLRKCVQLLLGRPEILVNSADVDGRTALIYAALSNDKELVQILLGTPGINVNARDRDGWTPLMAAILNDNLGIILALLDHPDIDTDGALIAAARYRRLDSMDILCQIPTINVNAQIRCGSTALIEVVYNYNPDKMYFPDEDFQNGLKPISPGFKQGKPCKNEMLSLLFGFKNLDANIRDQVGNTALMAAIDQLDVGLVEALLAVKGIDVNIRRQPVKQDGQHFYAPALFLALRKGKAGIRILRLLLSNPTIDVNILVHDSDISGDRFNFPHTALMEAVKLGNQEIVRLLLAADGIKVNATYHGQNALSIAASTNNRREIYIDLLAAGAKLPE